MAGAVSSLTIAFCQLSSSSSTSARKRKSTSSTTSPNTSTRSCTTPARRLERRASNCIRPSHGGARRDHGHRCQGRASHRAPMHPGVRVDPRAGRRDELVERQGADIDPVHVGELLDVEERRRALDVFQAEPLRQHADRHDLFVAGAPTEQRQVVAEGDRQVALVSVHLDRHRVAALGELLALLVDQQWEMGVGRERKFGPGGPVQRLPQHDLLGCGGELILAADDVRDGHGAVVDRIGQHEESPAVAADADEVIERPLGEGDLAADEIDYLDRTLVGRAEAQGAAVAAGQAQVAAMAVVARCRISGGGPLLGASVDLLAGAATGVQGAVGPQRLDGGAMGVPLGRLEVRALVGLHAQPGQRLNDAVGPLGAVALRVGVLNPQDEDAAALAQEEPVVQGGTGAADMEVPRRRRGEARPRGRRQSSSAMEMAPVGQPFTASRSFSRSSSGGFSFRT